MVIGEFLRRPAATDWKYLSDKAVGGIRAQVGCKLRVFRHRDQPAQRDFASQSLLKGRLSLDLFWEVGGIVDKILCYAIELNTLRCELYACRLHLG